MLYDVRVAADNEVESLRRELAPEERHLQARLADPRSFRVLVATVDDAIIGSAIVSWAPADEDEVRGRLPGVPIMFRLRVDEPHRCQGIGTTMIHRAEDLLRGLGHERVLIGVDWANRRACRLYESLGYETHDGLTGLGDEGEEYDVLVADLNRRAAAPSADFSVPA